MEHVWTVLCRRALVDADTNQISVLDAVDVITLVCDPERCAFEIDWVLAGAWTRSDIQKPEKGQFRVSLRSPSGKLRVDPKVYPLDLEESAWLRSRVVLQALPVDGPGRYVFLVDIEDGQSWKNVAQIPYDLEIEELRPEATPKKKTRRK